MPAKNPNRERTFGSKSNVDTFKNMINNSADAKKQKQLIQNETDPHLKVQNINTEDIIFNKNNKVFNSDDTEEDIDVLAESIDAYGLLHPINVVKRSDGKYLLLDGERRTKAFNHLRRRKISAFVYDSLEEYKQQGILYHANLLNRNLDDRKRFFAFKELKEYYEAIDQKMNKGDIESEISKLLGIAKRSVQRLERILKNASENDLFLLEQGEISFSEFKDRTYSLIAEQEREQDRRKSILAQGAKTVNYIDKKTNTVYLVDVDKNNENAYCTFLTNDSMFMVGFHTPSLPYRKDRQRAQVDLDVVASNNMWDVYDGDLSEYKAKTSSSTIKQTSEISKVTAGKISITDNEISESANEIKEEHLSGNNSVSEYTNSETNENKLHKPKHLSENAVVNPDKNSITFEDNKEAKSDEQFIESKKTLGKNQSPVYLEKLPQNEEKLNKEISTYIGYTISSNQRVDGPLWIAPSGKTYILRNVTIDKNIGNGKFEVSCIADEVNPQSIQRIDI